MSAKTSSIFSLAVAVALAIGVAFAVTRFGGGASSIAVQSQSGGTTSAASNPWTASAPGRVEPRNGDLRLTAQVPGRIFEVGVKVNDQVQGGDLLVRIDDDDARSRVAAAEAEAAVRKRERDTEAAVGRPAQDRRTAEDAVAAAERTLMTARAEFDRVLRLKREGSSTVTDENVRAERQNVISALERLDNERAGLRRALSASNLPLPTRLEAGLTAARAELSQADAALERTRIRAPTDGTILQVLARLGETAAPTPEQPLVVIGDLSALRVRAEVEERDVSKVRLGQGVIIRTDAYSGRDFTGRVTSVSQTLATARLPQRGPKRPTDLDTLEVLIEMDPSPNLLPGMRVDVFFKVPGLAPPSSQPASTPAAPPTAAK